LIDWRTLSIFMRNGQPATREWVRKAENDFKVASHILRRRKDIVQRLFSPVAGGFSQGVSSRHE